MARANVQNGIEVIDDRTQRLSRTSAADAIVANTRLKQMQTDFTSKAGQKELDNLVDRFNDSIKEMQNSAAGFTKSQIESYERMRQQLNTIYSKVTSQEEVRISEIVKIKELQYKLEQKELDRLIKQQKELEDSGKDFDKLLEAQYERIYRANAELVEMKDTLNAAGDSLGKLSKSIEDTTVKFSQVLTAFNTSKILGGTDEKTLAELRKSTQNSLGLTSSEFQDFKNDLLKQNIEMNKNIGASVYGLEDTKQAMEVIISSGIDSRNLASDTYKQIVRGNKLLNLSVETQEAQLKAMYKYGDNEMMKRSNERIAGLLESNLNVNKQTLEQYEQQMLDSLDALDFLGGDARKNFEKSYTATSTALDSTYGAGTGDLFKSVFDDIVKNQYESDYTAILGKNFDSVLNSANTGNYNQFAKILESSMREYNSALGGDSRSRQMINNAIGSQEASAIIGRMNNAEGNGNSFEKNLGDAYKAVEKGSTAQENQEKTLKENTGLLGRMSNWLGNTFGQLDWSGFINLGSAAFAAYLASQTVSGIKGIGDFIGKLGGKGKGSGLLSGAKNLGGKAVTGAKGLGSSIVGGVKSFASGSGSGLLGKAGSLLKGGLGKVAGVGGLISVGVDAVSGYGKADDWFKKENKGKKATTGQKVASTIGSALGGTKSGLSGALGGAAKGAALGSFLGPVGTLVGGGVGGLLGAIGGKNIAKGLSAAGKGISNVVGGAAKGIGDFFGGIFGGDKKKDSAAAKAGSKVKDVGKAVFNATPLGGIINTAKGVGSALFGKKYDKNGNEIKQTLGDRLLGAGKAVLTENPITKGFKSVLGLFKKKKDPKKEKQEEDAAKANIKTAEYLKEQDKIMKQSAKNAQTKSSLKGTGGYEGRGGSGSSGGKGGSSYPWPVSSGYGYRNTIKNGKVVPGSTSFHHGLDFAKPQGTKIGAAAPGTVVTAGWDKGGGGNATVIRGDNGLLYRYLHQVKTPPVKVGQRVNTGDLVGYVGSTGNSTGNHLHFQVDRGWKNNDWDSLDPNGYVSSGLFNANGDSWDGQTQVTTDTSKGISPTKTQLKYVEERFQRVQGGMGGYETAQNEEMKYVVQSGFSNIEQTLINLATRQDEQEAILNSLTSPKRRIPQQ